MGGLDPRLKQDRWVVVIVAMIGFAFAMAQPFAPSVSNSWAWNAAMIDGVVFAHYAGVCYAVRDSPCDWLRATLVAVLGFTQPVWIFPASFLVPLGGSPLIVTAAVLGVTMALLSMRLWMLVPVVVMLAVGLLLAAWTQPLQHLWMAFASFSALHLGLLAAIVPDTWLRLNAKHAASLKASARSTLAEAQSWNPPNEPQHTPRRDRTQVGCIAGFGVLWALAQPLLALSDSGFAVSAFGNGIAFAVYAAYLYALRGGRSNAVRAVIVALIGATHFFWMLPLASAMDPMLPAPIASEAHAMLAVTGLVLGGTVSLLSRRWVMLVPAGVGTMLAMAVISLPVSSIDPMVPLGFGIMLLHLGLLAALVPDTLRRLPGKYASNTCTSCGYDLRGLPAHTCPECGASASR